MFAAAVSPSAMPLSNAATALTAATDRPSALSLPFSPTSRYFDPALDDAEGRVAVMVAMQASAPTAEVAKYMDGARAVPSIGDVRLVRGVIDASKIGDLESSPYVLAILKDRPIPYDMSRKLAANPHLAAQFKDAHLPEATGIERESLSGSPEITMRDVVNFTGARRAWTQLGVNGAGVTIAVVDTGVDFGAFNLRESAVARNATGVPISFDPDGSTFARTPISRPPVACAVGPPGLCISTLGINPLIYVFDLFSFYPGGYGAKFLPWSTITGGLPFPAEWRITGLPASLSNAYRFGVLFEWNFGIDLFPVLLIDTTLAGRYDTAYLDLSYDWVRQGFAPPPADFSFMDESPLRPTVGGNVVAARDMNVPADGYPDISAGSLAWALDIWGLDPTPPPTGRGYVAPIDTSGEYLTMLYDWESHGTFVAASAAGRESNHPLAGPGTGPGAKIMGVPIFAWFDIIEGWLYAAGFDLVGTPTPRFVPNYGCCVYGTWTYTGSHKADIISNSWGVSDWIPFAWANGWPWYDVLTVVEDALMTPGYADPAYPGTVMVHAGGNGASGYGTMTGPGFNSLAITVGASTNLNHTSLPLYKGTHFDVISWSARGPNAFGAPKPDVLQVGAFAWAAGPLWVAMPPSGPPSGVNAYGLFGGTSQATPVTSGSAAVLIQAYKAGHGGAAPSPFQVKSILKSTASDLGYDAFVQGAGHIDVYNAAAYARGDAGILTTSPATWDNLRPWVAAPWSSAYVFYGQQVGPNPPVGPIADTSWFAGAVKPGSSTSTSFTITPARGSVSGTVAPVWHTRLAGTITRTGITRPLPGAPGSWLEGFGEFEGRPPATIPIPPSARLMVVRGSMPYSYLDVNGDYVWDNRSRIIVADWVDANADNTPQPAEISVFNYGYNTGTTFEARVGLPVGRFQGLPLLWFSQAPAAGRPFVPMPYRIDIEFYERLPWSWVTGPPTFTASAAAPATWAASLAVPAGTRPGVYEGQIIVSPAGGNATVVPVSVVVPAVINATTLSVTMTSAGSTQIYDPSTVLGYFDWRWRYEAGDWKLWFADVQDPTTVALYAQVSWVGANTDVDLWSVRPNGIPSDSSGSPYLGSGRFFRSTRTGTTTEWVAASTVGALSDSRPGTYTFLLHNVLLGSGATPPTPAALTGFVAAAKLSPRLPVTVVTQPGRVVSIPFTLSTGYDLANIGVNLFGQPTSAFPSTVFPTFRPLLGAGGSMTIWLNITVPSGTADGIYQNFASLFATRFPNTIVPVNVVVDATSPVVSVIAPGSGSFVGGSTVRISAAASDLNNIASMAFTAGTGSGLMARDPQTGLWTALWDTRTTPNGAATVRVTSTDTAGNSATDSVVVTVDNIAPSVTFSAPAENAWVRGIVTAGFSATDVNLASARLSYGGTTLDVMAATSAMVDTTTLGDGSQTITLTATDRAGNTASAALSVRVDNTKPIAVVTAPASGSFLRSTVNFSFVATDANVATAGLTIGTSVIDVTGVSTKAVDTRTLVDGAYSATLRVVDLAGNNATATASVTIDNAAPSVTFTSPAANANLRGVATIAWTITEQYVGQVWLIIDNQQRDVTGATSFSWDTTQAGDGAHTVTVRVVDKAGNVGSAPLTVTTDNVAQAVSTGFTNGLLVGLIAAAVVGFFVGWFLGRRRKEKPEADMPGPPPAPSPPAMEGPPPSTSPFEEEEL